MALLLIRKAVSKSLTYGHIGKIIINRRGKISTGSHFLCVTLSTLAAERVEESDFTTGLRSNRNSRNLSSINKSFKKKSPLTRGDLEGCPFYYAIFLVNIPLFPPFIRGTFYIRFNNRTQV